MKGNQLGGPYAGAIDFYDGVSFVNKDQMIQMMKIDEGRQSLRKLRCDDSVTSLPRYLGEGKWLVKGEQFYALMDKTGSLVTEFIYQQVNHYSDGIAAYRRGDLWGYLDNNGKELIDPVFGLAWDFSDQLARAAFRDGIAYINQKMEPPFIPRFRDMQNFTEGLAAVQEF
jgi:hypothetical protein